MRQVYVNLKTTKSIATLFVWFRPTGTVFVKEERDVVLGTEKERPEKKKGRGPTCLPDCR